MSLFVGLRSIATNQKFTGLLRLAKINGKRKLAIKIQHMKKIKKVKPLPPIKTTATVTEHVVM